MRIEQYDIRAFYMDVPEQNKHHGQLAMHIWHRDASFCKMECELFLKRVDIAYIIVTDKVLNRTSKQIADQYSLDRFFKEERDEHIQLLRK